MKSLLFIFLFQLSKTFAQDLPLLLEEQAEQLAQSLDQSIDLSDDEWLQSMQNFAIHKIDLNTVNEETLNQIRILDPGRIFNFLSYRKLLGKFSSLYELQAVPGWDLSIIEKLLPFVTINKEKASINSSLFKGNHTLLFRLSQVIQKAKGYHPADSGKSKYAGSPQRILMRYKYIGGKNFQVGLLGEKDPGEEFFRGNNRYGFDFYSANVNLRNIGKLKSIILGDYQVNLGQGLILWQGMSYTKGGEVMLIKRQSPILKPYQSSGEYYFFRGVAGTVQLKNIQLTLFGSSKRIDGNYVNDSISGESVTSIQTSGYHRTTAEISDEKIQRQKVIGGSLRYVGRRINIGLNGVSGVYKLALNKEDNPYNRFAFEGRSISNFSMDYNFTTRNLHAFGEFAIGQLNKPAFVGGAMISVAPKVDISLLYRNLSKRYQALFGSAFTENTSPVNEKGFYCGIQFRMNSRMIISAYSDFFKFPYLKYGLSAPSIGSDYLVQFVYKPDKQFELTGRFKSSRKQSDLNFDEDIISRTGLVNKTNLRLHLSSKFHREIEFRARVECNWYNEEGNKREQGYLWYQELLLKKGRTHVNLRVQFFETTGYNSRIYAYEGNVLYGGNIPVSYGEAIKYYVVARFKQTKNLNIGFKFSISKYKFPGIGSGNDEINGKVRSEGLCQMIYSF